MFLLPAFLAKRADQNDKGEDFMNKDIAMIHVFVSQNVSFERFTTSIVKVKYKSLKMSLKHTDFCHFVLNIVFRTYLEL
jgi:hypothetical protein